MTAIAEFWKNFRKFLKKSWKIYTFFRKLSKRELPILEMFLIEAPYQNHLFFPSVSYKGRFYRSPLCIHCILYSIVYLLIWKFNRKFVQMFLAIIIFHEWKLTCYFKLFFVIWNNLFSHETMHALGFWHEQMRPDASNYVIMYLQNVSPGLHDNFQPMPTENWGGAGFEYDIRKLSLQSLKFTNFAFRRFYFL